MPRTGRVKTYDKRPYILLFYTQFCLIRSILPFKRLVSQWNESFLISPLNYTLELCLTIFSLIVAILSAAVITLKVCVILINIVNAFVIWKNYFTCLHMFWLGLFFIYRKQSYASCSLVIFLVRNINWWYERPVSMSRSLKGH